MCAVMIKVTANGMCNYFRGLISLASKSDKRKNKKNSDEDLGRQDTRWRTRKRSLSHLRLCLFDAESSLLIYVWKVYLKSCLLRKKMKADFVSRSQDEVIRGRTHC